MKQMKRFPALVTGLLVIGLLLFASAAQAVEVCVDGDTVTEIKNLDVVTQQYDQVTTDVKFNFTTGFDIYGSSLDNMPFDFPYTEDDPYAVMLAINKALNEASPPFHNLSEYQVSKFSISEPTKKSQKVTRLLQPWALST